MNSDIEEVSATTEELVNEFSNASNGLRTTIANVKEAVLGVSRASEEGQMPAPLLFEKKKINFDKMISKSYYKNRVFVIWQKSDNNTGLICK